MGHRKTVRDAVCILVAVHSTIMMQMRVHVGCSSSVASPPTARQLFVRQNVVSAPSIRGNERRTTRLHASREKVQTLNEKWKKNFIATPGMFVEDSVIKQPNLYKGLENGAVLSKVESSGILSFLENNGLTLSTIERLGLLSKAEDLGVLSLLEEAINTDGAVIAGLAVPFGALSLGALAFIPEDSTGLIAVKYGLGGLFLVLAVVLLVAGQTVKEFQRS